MQRPGIAVEGRVGPAGDPGSGLAAAPGAHAWPGPAVAHCAAGFGGVELCSAAAHAAQRGAVPGSDRGRRMNVTSEGGWRDVVDQSPEGIVVCDATAPDCPVVYANA